MNIIQLLLSGGSTQPKTTAELRLPYPCAVAPIETGPSGLLGGSEGLGFRVLGLQGFLALGLWGLGFCDV